ncbi:MAG: serine hydrolase [Gammaproteobacteria bacterium]
MKHHSTHLRAALLLAVIPMFVALTPVRTAVAASSLLPTRIVQAAKSRVAAGEYPALVIAVVNDGKSHVYTFGKLAGGKAPDADTVFEIGSVTKTFTATLLAEAVKSGRDTLDEPVAKLLPGFTIPSRNGKHITLGSLAEQYSGLPRLPTNLQPSDPNNPYADYDAAKLKSFLAGYTLPRDPGSQYEYSNLGVGLLGYALAQQGGTSYGALVEEKILKPLGMTLSGVEIRPAMHKHLAVGHDGQGKPTENWDLDVLAGAGAIKSTGHDMLRYLEANMGVTKTPLDAAMRFAHKPRLPVGGDEQIGLVWMTRHDKDGDVIWHNGMTGGYASFLGFTADGKHGVVVLTNIGQSVDDLGFATLLPDAKLASTETAIHLSKQALDEYAGSYRLRPHFILTVFRQGGQLLAQATGQGALPIYPSARNEFFAKMADIRITFKRGKNDKVTELVLHQNGDHAAPRISGAEAARDTSQKPVVTLPESTLKEYVGHYQLAPGREFDITLKHGQLYAQLTGQGAFPIYASKKDEFFYTIVNAQISFQRGKDGKVTGLVLHQSGRDLPAPRGKD